MERIPVPLFSLFLDVLEEFRGDFLCMVSDLVSQNICDILYRKDLSQKYKFESLDRECLKREPLDSGNLIKYCELDS